jgi:hypothetical protein
MGMSLDIMKVKSVEFGEVVNHSDRATRTMTITTESGEQVELSLYADDDEQGASGKDKLRFSI